MKLFGWRLLVASSLLLGLTAKAETRPQYGGTLHIAMRSAPASLDPASLSIGDSVGRRSLAALMFDTLVSTDESGGVKPHLAEFWQFSQGNERCQLRLHQGVKFHDGALLTPAVAAASLRFANPSWNVQASGNMLVIESNAPGQNLLAELALPRNAIVRRDAADGNPVGSGPFHVVTWDPGKKLVLAAEENYWRGRPYLDGVDIELGKSFREQSTALQLGRADLVEIAPEQGQHTATEGRHITKSSPIELLALLFARDAASDEEKDARNALALSIERTSMHDVLMKGAGQPAGSILPTWISGYGFVFSSSADLARARQLRGAARTVPAWKLGYDAGEPLDRLLAERIALNAKDAGLSLQPSSSGTADIHLVRIPLASSDPWTALQTFLNQCGLSRVSGTGNSIGDLYAAEREVLAAGRVIPLFHLPVYYASSQALRRWSVRSDGSLDLSDAWLEATNP